MLPRCPGAPELSGIDVPVSKPTALPFASERPIVQMACADEASFALLADGTVWHWGRRCITNHGVQRTPKKIDELRDVAVVACSVPGYFHGRRTSASASFDIRAPL
jgi:hypothetical protein